MNRWDDPELEKVCKDGAKRFRAIIMTLKADILPSGALIEQKSPEEVMLFDACFWEKIAEELLDESRFLRGKLGLPE